MAALRVHNFAVSLDGFGAGPDQGLDDPLGRGGPPLHDWVFETRRGRAMIGADGGESGIDDDFFAAGEAGIGATIMGRNMFGPVRGSWGDGAWRGWWGEEPPYHHPVLVLTHQPREPVEMQGGTTFHFVTGGIEEALDRATEAAGSADVRLGGGVSTVLQYATAGLVDSLHLAVVPVLLGAGERLVGPELSAAGYRIVDHVASERVLHVRLARS